MCQFLSFDTGHFGQDNSVLWGAVLCTGLYSPDTVLQVMTTKMSLKRHCWKSPWRQNCPRLKHCFILTTANITWALDTACRHTAHPQFNHPPILPDASFTPSLVSSNLQFLLAPCQLMTFTEKSKQSEFLPASTIKHLSPQSSHSLPLRCSPGVLASQGRHSSNVPALASAPSAKHAHFPNLKPNKTLLTAKPPLATALFSIAP